MVSIIVYGNQSSASNASRIITQAHAAGSDVIYVGPAQLAGLMDSRFIDSANGSLHEQIMAACDLAQGKQLLLINAELFISDESLAQLIKTADTQSNSIAVASFGTGENIVSLPAFATEHLVESITTVQAWPLAILAVSQDMIRMTSSVETDFFSVLVGNMLVEAASHDIGIGNLPIEIVASNLDAVTTLSSKEISQLLEHAVNTYNIEDLFPNHAWQEFSEESAAASYHTLAAKFITLNDFDSAQQCLSFSDSLEDSPRSQGLKAIISMSQGETLGAVANLVSSLQQYEVRKTGSTTSHYLSFAPNNLEVINDNLHQGLDALNKRDNATALEHFANAVFNFDSFYGENGIDKIKDPTL